MAGGAESGGRELGDIEFGDAESKVGRTADTEV
jgi:hypothetical protein